MLEEAFRGMGDGVYIKSRQNADLFTVAHFRAKTKITNIIVRELLFADDSVLIAHSAEEIQRIVDAFSSASSKFGLKINIEKTEVMFQPNSIMTTEVPTTPACTWRNRPEEDLSFGKLESTLPSRTVVKSIEFFMESSQSCAATLSHSLLN